MQHLSSLSFRTFALTSLTAVALTGCLDKGQQSTGQTPPPPQVVVMSVQSKAMPLYTELPGRTAPHLIAEVRPQVTGILKSRLFTEGADVKAGAPLYQIDASSYKALADSAKASLEKAQANLVSAEIRNTRFQELAQQNAVSQQERDDAYAALKQAQADVASAKAALQNAQINLAYTQVKAPISGRIGRSGITAGALVQTGQAQALATIQQLDPMYVDVTQSTAELLQLKRDIDNGAVKSSKKDSAKTRLILEDGTEYEHDGTLQFSEATVDANTGTVTLRAVFPNPKKKLLPGMYVRAIVQEGVRQDAILVPQKAVARDNTGAAIAYVVLENNVLEKRIVQTGAALGDQWIVQSGLKAGDRLVVEGLQKIKAGQTVEIIEASPAAK